VAGLERDTSSLIILDDTDDDGLANSKAKIAAAHNLNHGLAFHDRFMYAPSKEMVQNLPPWMEMETPRVMNPSIC